MLQKSNICNVLELFFTNPTKKFYLIDISRKIKLAHTSVKKVLEILLKREIIIRIIEKRGERNFPYYIANVNSNEFINLKKVYNYDSIIFSGVIELINEKIMPACIVLFGSYQRGEDLEDSDIDLFIGSKKKPLDLEKYEKKLKRKIQLHFNDTFANYSTELKNNIINGIAIKGYLEVY
ncbi:nucleotidyltransferase domain-containing protein [Candidatus Woesearchaeota archaeon]|nr:nucleotidyltransferase domain-containing protein [Candidatus Woesearchaeota archaeon]